MIAPPFWCTAPFSRALAGAFSAGTFAASPSADACSCRKCSACNAAMQPAINKRLSSANVALLISESRLQTMTLHAARQQGMQELT